MEQQQQQQLDQQLRQNWQQIRYQILDNFAQLSTADVDSARSVDDLVQRIADRSHHSEGFVENRLMELVGTTTQGSSGPSGQPYGSQPQASQNPTGQQGQPFRANRP